MSSSALQVGQSGLVFSGSIQRQLLNAIGSSTLLSKKRPAEDNDGPSMEGSERHKVAKVHPFFSKSSKEPKTTNAFQWHKALGARSSCLYGTNLIPACSPKVAAFDLDGTLIKPSFGKGAVKKALKGSPPAWEWWKDKVPDTLKDLNSEGYSIVIISNQAIKGASLITWKEKIGLIAAALPSVPFRILAAIAKDEYRKPMPGMWTELTKKFKDEGVEIDKTASFFVGDAAGRDSDFASTDRKWALNVDLPFFTPEEYFLKQPVQTKFKLDGFSVVDLPTLPLFSLDTPVIPDIRQREIVVLVGYPGVGKSTICQRYFVSRGYERINQDTLGTRPKCVAAVEKALQKDLSCVVDNTNRDVQTRKFYVDVARKFKVPIRCFVFSGSIELAWHNNLYRAFNQPPSTASQEEKRALVPYLAFTSFRNGYEEPTLSEGFSEIQTVNWVFEGTEEERKYWSMWLQIQGK
ncbi:polynucleotide kinase 3 phosphatase-domain-containing protein [Lentinula detonsa]|uniref:Polynucleotide kinase 3 phosphatase-domain-containing protein n=1 Tax=Lentinula detonsa TaxID=2804962 RepID=A0A9W8TVB3_9AGAR|nr:polynucleotide kinase 3 phosphatase-domain-containing protein [Lentinula detonsa]